MKKSQRKYEEHGVADCMAVIFFFIATSLSYILICDRFVIKPWWFYWIFVIAAIVLWVLSFIPIYLFADWVQDKKIYTNVGSGFKNVIYFLTALILGFLSPALGLFVVVICLIVFIVCCLFGSKDCDPGGY
jgi:hypothetical protein